MAVRTRQAHRSVHNRVVTPVRTAILATLALAVASAAAACGGRQAASSQPRVVVVGTSILIVSDADEMVPIEIPFRVNSDILEDESYGPLDVLAVFLDQHHDLTLIEVQGHSDERGSPEHNLALSRRRAESVVAYLVGKGVEPSRLRSTGFGSKRPAARGADELAWSQNRRVEFVIVGRSDEAE